PTEIDARETMPRFALSSRLTLRGEQQPRLFKLKKWPSARSHRKGLLCSSVFPRFPGFASSITFGVEAHQQSRGKGFPSFWSHFLLRFSTASEQNPVLGPSVSWSPAKHEQHNH
ncbi:MAG TPA: hypothetical protein VKR06_16110, partial [Ktedonosporobacter sp.]|nr:hypothetical protein [Ktedonosporobacter sp.]